MNVKKIISVLLSCVLVLSLSVTAYAADKKLSSDMSLEDLQKFAKKNTYSYKIYEYEKENAEMQKDSKENELEYYEYLLRSTSRSDEKYYEYKLKVSELKKEAELAKMDFEYYDGDKEDIDKKLLDLSLKSKYYELCLLDGQRKNQQLKVKHLKKRAEIETVKLKSGQSTDNEKQLADMSLKLAENELSAVKKSMGNKKLWKKFSENSFELEKERKGMEFDGDHLEEVKKIYGEDSDTYKSCKNSYEIDKLNFEARENEYEAKIAALLSDYDTAWLEYAACLEYNKILRDKLSILKVAYDSGK